MIVPSILIMAIGGAAMIVLAALLRCVASEARELAQTRARASGPKTTIGASSLKEAAWQAGPVRGGTTLGCFGRSRALR
jgi:hypothetical protein